MSRKPRTDARLKTLPPEQQEQLFAHLRKTPYRKAVKWCAEELGVETSVGALSEFFGWFPLSRQLEQAATFAEQITEQAKADPELVGKSAEIARFAQIGFEARALELQDASLYVELAKLRLKAESNALQERRIKILEAQAAKAAEAEKVVNDNTLSEEERALRMRQIFRMT
jgi:hypothetical protein